MSCVVAHDAAYYDAKILHRDISVGNIMISEGGGGGFLIYWDMCAHVEEGQSHQGGWRGLWGFAFCSKIALLLTSL